MSNTTSPEVNKLEQFVSNAVNAYKAAFDTGDWEKMEQLLASQPSSHKSRKTGSFPVTTVIAAVLAIAVLGAIIYQLSRKGISPDIETVTPAPVETKPEPTAKPPVKSKLDEIVPEKDDSADAEQMVNKDSIVPEKPAETKINTNTDVPLNNRNNATVTSAPANTNNTGNTENTSNTNTNNTSNTGNTNNNGSSGNTDNTNVNKPYVKPPPSALTILYNKRRREKLKKDSIQRTIVPAKTIGSDIKQPDNLQIKTIEEPKLKGLNNMYKKNKSDSTQ